MSMEYSVFIADWDEMVAKLQKSDAFEVLTGEEVEDEEGECVQQGGMEEEDISVDSVRAQMDFMSSCGRFAFSAQSASGAHFEKVFNTIFGYCLSEYQQIIEIDAPSENIEGIGTALNPEKTRQLAGEAALINLDECTDSQPHVKEENSYFPTLDEFKAYAQEWIDILRKAAEQDKGVVVLVFG